MNNVLYVTFFRQSTSLQVLHYIGPTFFGPDHHTYYMVQSMWTPNCELQINMFWCSQWRVHRTKHFRQFWASNLKETIWRRFFSVLAWLHPPAQSQLYKDMVWWVWCGGTWVALISTLLDTFWDELKCRIQARSSHPTTVPNLTYTLLVEWA